MSADQVIARLRPEARPGAGRQLFLQAVQDIRVGGRQSNAQYQYTLQADSCPTSTPGRPSSSRRCSRTAVLTDVDSDQQQHGLEVDVTIDRDAAARLGITHAQHIDRRSTTPSASARSRPSTTP